MDSIRQSLGQRKKGRKPQVLEAKDVPSLAKYIKSDGCKNIVLMLGAGISTSAGIPDFRSPKTGLYSNLARLNLPHPEAVFEINFFRSNPIPFYTLAHELYPGKFRPTITHSFIRLLAEKQLLFTCFTQNIDTLERRAGVPDNKIIEAHGSFATQRCIDCKTQFDDERMKQHILEKTIALCDHCKGYVKPDIVFFGEALPPKFIRSISCVAQADLLIVMGTSLTVHPFASLAGMADDTCPRVLINLDHVGDFGSKSDDVVLLGKCDDIVRDLCKELGWEDELLELWKATESTVEKTEEEEEELSPLSTTDASEELRIQKEVDEITAAVEKSLALNNVTEGSSISAPSSQKPDTEQSVTANEPSTTPLTQPQPQDGVTKGAHSPPGQEKL